MNSGINNTVQGSWTQTGGQDPTMPVDYFSLSWWWEQRDRRSDTYPLLNSPSLMILISTLYVIFVTLVGPWMMRDRKPFDLKNTLMAYNLFQVILSVYMVIEAWDAGWGRHLSWICQNVEAGTEPGSPPMRMIAITYVYMINKYIEFADTFFMVFKKKNNQITLLHVYHHAIMPVYSWLQMRFLPGGHEIWSGQMNCYVHIVMYTYYLLSAFGPGMQKYLWWKKYITLIQLTQFCIAITRTLTVATGVVECGYPWQNCLGTFIFIEAPFFLLFLDFYLKSYSKSSKTKSATKPEQTNGVMANGKSQKTE